MMRTLKLFLADDAGAVTVDWVVLTASIVVLAFLVISQIAGPTTNVGTRVGDYVANAPVGNN
jgi:Flp pilus assembly pilin Flp